MSQYITQTATRTAERALLGTALGALAGFTLISLSVHGVNIPPALVPAGGFNLSAYMATGAMAGAAWGLAESAIGKSFARAWSDTPNGVLAR